MPRKTPSVHAAAGGLDGASMRPRPDAAENARDRQGARRGREASMRPRPDAAENDPVAIADDGVTRALQ